MMMLLWPGGARADACGAFHMRARYGFQHETGESVLADTIEWRHIGRGMALKEPDGKDKDGADTSTGVDAEGWFNPLVYEHGVRLRPRLKNLQGEELSEMPPLRIQDKKWEDRFISGVSNSDDSEQRYHELRHFTLTGFVPTCRPVGTMLPGGVRELCGQTYVEVEVASAFDPKTLKPVDWCDAKWPQPKSKHQRRPEPWMRKWGDRWTGTGALGARGHGPGGGTDDLALSFETAETDVVDMMMCRMRKEMQDQL